MPTTIRRFRKSERELWEPLWCGYYEDASHPHPIKRLRNKVWDNMIDPENPLICYGIFYRNKAVGFINIYPRHTPHALKPILYISDIYIAPEFRRKKLGTYLLEYVFTKISPKYSRTEWKALDGNMPAIKLYKKYAKQSNWIIFERKQPQ